jgi:hypothetical protein
MPLFHFDLWTAPALGNTDIGLFLRSDMARTLSADARPLPLLIDDDAAALPFASRGEVKQKPQRLACDYVVQDAVVGARGMTVRTQGRVALNNLTRGQDGVAYAVLIGEREKLIGLITDVRLSPNDRIETKIG